MVIRQNGFLTYPHSGGDIFEDMLMEGVKVNFGQFAEIENTHTAANVYPDDIRDNLVAEVAGEADDTSGSGVNVRHNAYFLVREYVDGEQLLNLIQSGGLNVVREDFDVVSFNCFHKLKCFLRF